MADMNFMLLSKAELDLLIKFTEFKCKCSDLKVSMERSSLSAGSFASLKLVWVLGHGFPNWARQEKIVEEVAYLVGDPEMVDSKSLSGTGPIRVRIWCKEPSEIKGSSNVFFNEAGYKITWKVEQENRQGVEGDPQELQDEDEDPEDDDDKEKSDRYTPLLEEYAGSKENPTRGDDGQNSQSTQHNKGTTTQGQYNKASLGQDMSCELLGRSNITPTSTGISNPASDNPPLSAP